MSNLVYVLVGVAWSLIFIDAYLTLHGLSSGKLIEKNRLMGWFVKSPVRLYPFTAAVCFLTYFVAHVLAVWSGWVYGAVFCSPIIVQRAIIVSKNYKLNVRVL